MWRGEKYEKSLEPMNLYLISFVCADIDDVEIYFDGSEWRGLNVEVT